MAAMATGLSAAKVLQHSARRFGGLNRNFHAFGAVVVGIHPLPPFRAFSATASATASTSTSTTTTAAAASESAIKSVFEKGDDGVVKAGGGSEDRDRIATTPIETTKEESPRTVAAGRSRKRPRPWRRKQPRDGSSLDCDDELKADGSITVEKSARSSIDRSINEMPKSELWIPVENERGDESSSSSSASSSSSSLPYPKGKPWRILWPYPYGEPTKSPRPTSLWDYRKRIPTPEDFRAAWKLYMETWEDGIRGEPSRNNKDKDSTANTNTNGNANATNDHGNAGDGNGNGDGDDTTPKHSAAAMEARARRQLRDVGDNATKNLNMVREDAQTLLEHAKETTGIRSQEDAKALASEAMKIATECIREFMAGYRKGRDSEIDKMLHEYFQDENENESKNENENDSNDVAQGGDNEMSATKDGNTNNEQAIATTVRKKRKPRRGLPRT